MRNAATQGNERRRAAPSARSLANLKPWRPGQSGNPGGSSRRVVEYRSIIEHQETPQCVAAVVAKLRELCIQQGDVKAGAVYLKAVGAIDENKVPIDRVEELAAKMLQASVEKARRELESRTIDVTATEVPG